MIIQTGMRTDIPAFYSRWLLNRLKEGTVLVRNPYDPQSVTRYRLDPKVVDLIAFCSKNPAPMLPHMDALKDYGQYWFVTITPYGRDIEPNVPDKEKVMEDFKRLSDVVAWTPWAGAVTPSSSPTAIRWSGISRTSSTWPKRSPAIPKAA